MKLKTIFLTMLLVILPLSAAGCSEGGSSSNGGATSSNNLGKQKVTLLSSLRSPGPLSIK